MLFDPYDDELELEYDDFEPEDDIFSACVACSVGDHEACTDLPDYVDKACCCE